MVTTNTFKNAIAGNIIGTSYDAASYIAFGDDDTTETVNDTSLGNELDRNIYTSRSQTNNSVRIISTLTTTELNGSTIKEIGLFNASSGGDLFSREVISDIDKTSSFELEVTYVITIL